MKIGFDAKRAVQNRTGLGNYSRFVIDILTTYANRNEYVLYAPKYPKKNLLGKLSDNAMLSLPTSAMWKKFSAIWRIWGVTKEIKQAEIQLFHGLSNELPLNISKAKQCKSIVTIHDLIFLRYPSYYRFIDRQIYTYKFRRACLKANRIIAISECTKRDIMHFFGIREEKIDIVYQGCDKQFQKTATIETKNRIREKYQLPEQYILYVGSIEERKNLLLLAKALKYVQPDIQVVAIGKRTPYLETIESYLKENQLEDRMHFFSNIPFDELPAFYQMATTFVYPSFFEGFGIPLLEALYSGTPAIGATGSCLEEAGGPHSLYVNPESELELADAINRTLSDQELRQTMIAEGKKYAALFEESKLAADLLKVYEKTISENSI
ncbi:MAG: glycosyltransferase family 1 protein [Bacteroides sp.]